MDKQKKTGWWSRVKPSRRRLIQLYAALLTNARVTGFSDGTIYTGPLKNLCTPGLNCYSCPGAVMACPLGALQNAIASSGTRLPTLMLGIILLLGITLGRIICGWLCPVGLMQELLHKLPTPKVKKSRFTRWLTLLKYLILLVFVVLIPVIYAFQQIPVPGFCKYICPAGTLEGAVGLLSHPVNADKFSMLGILFTNKIVLAALFLAGSVFIFRVFCRFICPLGALYGLLNRFSLFGVKVSQDKCVSCMRCVTHCRMDIRKPGDRECIHCGECVSRCPTKAIEWKKGLIMLQPNEGTKNEGTKNEGTKPETAVKAPDPKKEKLRLAMRWAAALAVLAAVMITVNQPAPVQASPENDPPAVTEEDTAPVGHETGMRCPDFTAPLYGAEGGSFALSETRGKVVVINFWATWCGPCCKELPHFQQLYEAYPEDVALVAIHSNLITEDVQKWLDRQSYTLPFALDGDGSIIASLGGSTMLPQTVILDRMGRILYNKVGSVTYEVLEELVKQGL